MNNKKVRMPAIIHQSNRALISSHSVHIVRQHESHRPVNDWERKDFERDFFKLKKANFFTTKQKNFKISQQTIWPIDSRPVRNNLFDFPLCR